MFSELKCGRCQENCSLVLIVLEEMSIYGSSFGISGIVVRPYFINGKALAVFEFNLLCFILVQLTRFCIFRYII